MKISETKLIRANCRPGLSALLRPAGHVMAAMVACLALMGVASAPAHATPPAGYTLTFDDEFNGAVNSQPNSANWNFDTGTGSDGWGNFELETYVTDVQHCHIISDPNATDGLALQIEATDNNGGVGTAGTYSSARINTIGKVTPTYGYIELRAKLPYGQGIWPAFWSLGTNLPTAGWPECGEMDIMELFGQSDGTNMGSFHMGTESSPIDWTADYTLPNGGLFDQAYHTFGLLWTSTGVTDYVDGNEYETHPSSSPGWVFNHPFYFLINLAVGGIPPGEPNSSTVFPQYLDIDYLRIYEPSSGGGGGGNLANGTYTLTPQCSTGSRLDDSGSGTTNGNKIDIYQSNGTGAQNWALSSSGVSPSGDYNLAALGPYCLDASGTTSGSAAELWACNGSTAQSWKVVADSSPSGYYQLQPANSTGLCLDVSGAGTANGTAVQVYTCNNTNAQQWLPTVN